MKAEHVSTIVRFLRGMKPVDLLLPVGAALVSAGIQNLVDREDRQRRRLVALDELVDVHRTALADAGVELPAELAGDESHPLDVESALQVLLARTPGEQEPAADEPRPPRRGLRALAVLGLAGAAGVTMWARGRARIYGQDPTVLGFLSTLRGPDGAGPAWPKTYPSHSHDYGEGICPICGADGVSGAALLDEHKHRYASDLDSVCETCGEKSRPSPADAPTLSHEGSDRWTGGDLKDEGIIGKGEPPLEECGWPSCSWTSDATRSEVSQRTAAAVHRNRCVYRPAGAGVEG